MSSLNSNVGTAATPDDLERLRRILDKDEYTVYHNLAADGDRFNLSQWIAKQLRKLFPSFDVPPGTGKAFEYGLIILLLAIVVLAIIWFSRRLVRQSRLRAWAELKEELAGQSPESFLQQARELAASGRLRDAMRSGFLALLGSLERQGRICVERWKTNWEYADELKRGDASELAVPFRDAAAEFEKVWYGKEPVPVGRFEAFYALVTTMLEDGEGERHAPME